jgi:hypothetical protein
MEDISHPIQCPVETVDEFIPSDSRIERLLLISGAIKAGTTWLFSVLRQHPLIATPLIKEIHFFTPATLPWEPLADAARIETMARYFGNQGPFAKSAPDLASAARADLGWFDRYLNGPVDLDWFRALFGDGHPQRYISDFSPFTSLGGPADLERIRAYSQQRRLIYLIRNPLERYWSHYNFHKSLFAPQEDITAHDESHYAKELDGDDFAMHGQYGRFIADARSVLDASELLVLPIEDCRADPLTAIRKVETFLDLPPAIYEPASLREAVFSSRALEIPDAFRCACEPLIERDCAVLDSLGVAYPESYRTAALRCEERSA